MSEKASVKLSTKKWHYKLIKFILGNAAPTPQNMHNLCPYFWLLVFSLLVTPIVGPIKLIGRLLGKILDGFADLLDRLIVIPSAENWEEGLSDLDVYQILSWDKEIQKFYKKLHYSNEYYSKERFAYDWWRKTYKKNVFEDEDQGNRVYGTYTDEFAEWLHSCHNELEKLQAQLSKEEIERQRRKLEKEENLKKFRNGMDSVGNKIKSTVLSWKSIIKWTKRVVGLIVTGVLLVATYFVVNFAGRGVLWLVDNWSWPIFFIVLLVIAGLAVAIVILFLLRAWIDYIESKGAMNVWYTKWIYYLVKYVLWMPVRFVFYTVLWKLLALNIWYVIKRGAQLVWGSFLGFLGIFGEYFGASYTDYCPGIDWEEEK